MNPSKLERLKKGEDEMSGFADSLPCWKQAVLYRYLNGIGITLDRCTQIIEDGLKVNTDPEFCA